jgi:hypothetical protein
LNLRTNWALRSRDWAATVTNLAVTLADWQLKLVGLLESAALLLPFVVAAVWFLDKGTPVTRSTIFWTFWMAFILVLPVFLVKPPRDESGGRHWSLGFLLGVCLVVALCTAASAIWRSPTANRRRVVIASVVGAFLWPGILLLGAIAAGGD